MENEETEVDRRADETVTGELFQWSYRHLNENANNLIKGLERAERERERRHKKVGSRRRRSEVEEADEGRRTERDEGRGGEEGRGGQTLRE